MAFVALVALAAFTSSWTGIALGPLKVSDAFAVLALLLGVLGPFRRELNVRPWMFVPIAGAAAVLVVHIIFGSAPAEVGVIDLGRTFLGLTVVALLSLSLHYAEAVLTLKFWVLGAAANALAIPLTSAGFLPASGLASDIDISQRAVGLAFHPNSLAFSTVVAIPFACMLLFRHSRGSERLVWTAVLALYVNGLIAADSRAGLGIGLTVLFISLVIAMAATRWAALVVPIGILSLVGVIAWLLPYLQSTTRLGGQLGLLSDAGRDAYNAEGMHRFAQNVWFGAGFDEAIGTSMYVHLLSKFGLVGALSYFLFIGAVVVLMISCARGVDRALGLLGVVAALAFGVLQPGATERATYWGAMLVIAAWHSRRDTSSPLARLRSVRPDSRQLMRRGFAGGV
ncbi:hypothetical protein ACIGCK_01895 [Microbacterium sp. NPDC078428]|uniref:hypothetical protein n=1 Tax=Microbacterium sp. NPDC078428 TaxID=3364190 RepID=UPI0037C603DF